MSMRMPDGTWKLPGERRCSICHRLFHNKRNCPELLGPIIVPTFPGPPHHPPVCRGHHRNADQNRWIHKTVAEKGYCWEYGCNPLYAMDRETWDEVSRWLRLAEDSLGITAARQAEIQAICDVENEKNRARNEERYARQDEARESRNAARRKTG